MHERPAEAGGCFLDLLPLSLRNDAVSSSVLREGIYRLYVRKEEGRMSRKGAAVQGPEGKDDKCELEALEDRDVF